MSLANYCNDDLRHCFVFVHIIPLNVLLFCNDDLRHCLVFVHILPYKYFSSSAFFLSGNPFHFARSACYSYLCNLLLPDSFQIV